LSALRGPCPWTYLSTLLQDALLHCQVVLLGTKEHQSLCVCGAEEELRVHWRDKDPLIIPFVFKNILV